MISTDLDQILVSFGVILASLDMALMVSQTKKRKALAYQIKIIYMYL